MKKILVVDDEADIVDMLGDILFLSGYTVLKARGGEEALRLTGKNPDLILLDINMPGIDGLSVCRAIRDVISCPVLFLTARVTEEDKIYGFQAGADDYILKPFNTGELLARVEAHLRREERRGASAQIKYAGGVIIDYTERTASKDGKRIPLPKKEFEIIELLSLHAGQVFDKDRIYEAVWGYDSEGDSSVVAEHIRRIRGKLEKAGAENRIETVWGVGYKWRK